MKINDCVYLVGSGKTGMQISHKLDCNVYVLDGGNGEYALIDAGAGIQPERIITNIESNGIKMENIKYLLITHIHGDHAAGAAYFKKNYGMKIVMAEEVVKWFETGDMDKTSINQAIAAGVYPENFEYPICNVDYAVNEGDTVKVGDIKIEIIETPGHSRGHISFLWKDNENGKKSLFSGDAVLAGGKIILQNIWDCNISEYAETMNKLNQYKIDRLFPGHGISLLESAYNHIDSSCKCFNQLGIPPNI